MKQYKLLKYDGIGSRCVSPVDENGNTTKCIPFCDGNSDYQDYLKWVAEGNEPLPADEPSEG